MGETKKEKRSLIAAIGIIKDKIQKDGGFFDHVLFGIDVDNDGTPMSIVQSVHTGSYLGLGMIKAIRIMIDRADKQITDGYIGILEKEDADIPDEAIEKLQNDDVIRGVIMEYNDRITEEKC